MLLQEVPTYCISHFFATAKLHIFQQTQSLLPYSQ